MKSPSTARAAGCFLIGSGPSLNRTAVRALGDYDTIAFNRSFVGWERWRFQPTYYACFDPLVIAGNAAELQSLINDASVLRFFLNRSAASFGIRPSKRVTLVEMVEGTAFCSELERLTDFGNVGASSLQILAALGYCRVAMVGVDARYSERVCTAQTGDEIAAGPDPDHFTPEYTIGKQRQAHPDMDKILGQWPRVAGACRQLGLDVRNASPGTALTCFETMEFTDALGWIGPTRDHRILDIEHTHL